MKRNKHSETAAKLARAYFAAEPSRQVLLERDIHRALSRVEVEAMRLAADIAKLEALRSGNRVRRTKTLGLKRETYAHEYGNDIAAAILSEAEKADA